MSDTGKIALCREQAQRLQKDLPEVLGWALITIDGIVTLTDLPEGVAEDFLGTAGAAIMTICRRWAESVDGCPAEYALLGNCRSRLLLLPAGEEAILALFLDAQGDWNVVVGAACGLADGMGRVFADGEAGECGGA